MYPMGEKYAPPLPSTIGEVGRRGPKVAGWWLDCDDQGIHGQIVGISWWAACDRGLWWEVVTETSNFTAIPDGTACTYRHPVGLDALADALRHTA